MLGPLIGIVATVFIFNLTADFRASHTSSSDRVSQLALSSSALQKAGNPKSCVPRHMYEVYVDSSGVVRVKDNGINPKYATQQYENNCRLQPNNKKVCPPAVVRYMVVAKTKPEVREEECLNGSPIEVIGANDELAKTGLAQNPAAPRFQDLELADLKRAQTAGEVTNIPNFPSELLYTSPETLGDSYTPVAPSETGDRIADLAGRETTLPLQKEPWADVDPNLYLEQKKMESVMRRGDFYLNLQVPRPEYPGLTPLWAGQTDIPIPAPRPSAWDRFWADPPRAILDFGSGLSSLVGGQPENSPASVIEERFFSTSDFPQVELNATDVLRAAPPELQYRPEFDSDFSSLGNGAGDLAVGASNQQPAGVGEVTESIPKTNFAISAEEQAAYERGPEPSRLPWDANRNKLQYNFGVALPYRFKQTMQWIGL